MDTSNKQTPIYSTQFLKSELHSDSQCRVLFLEDAREEEEEEEEGH